MKMIDVGEKERTSRVAVARAELRCSRETLKLLNEGRLEKGDALAGADVEVACDENAGVVRIEARVHALDRTGVEMEALTAVMAASLTIYDMCKRHDKGMEITSVRLIHKSGGRSGTWNRDGETQPRADEPLVTPRGGTRKLQR